MISAGYLLWKQSTGSLVSVTLHHVVGPFSDSITFRHIINSVLLLGEDPDQHVP